MPTATSPRTTVRWDADEFAWLERAAALRAGGRVGAVVRALVRAAMVGAEVDAITADIEARAGVGGASAGVCDACAGRAVAGLGTECGEPGGCGRDASALVVTVPRGAAPVTPSGAAPRAAARQVRLEVVVARVLEPRGGQIAPVTLAAARRKIRAGEVEVSGRGSAGLDPGQLVGPGEVVVR